MLDACRKCGAPLLMHRIRFAGWLRGFRIACPQLVSGLSRERYVPATEVTAPVAWPGRALVLRIDAPHLGDDAFYPLVTHALQDAIQHNNATSGGEFPPGGRYLFQGTPREVRVRLFLPDDESAVESGRIICYGNPEPRSSWVKARFLHPDDSKNFGRIEIDAEAHDSLTATMAVIEGQAERAAVKTLERLGYTYHGAQQWKPPLGPKPNWLADRSAAAVPTGVVLVPPERNIDEGQDDYESADPYSLGHCDGWNDCRKAMLAAAPTEQSPVSDLRDAYEGAREDLLDWKRRAQRAEAELRRLGYKGVDATAEPAADPPAWRAIETAPRDGRLLRLLVQFDDHATEDSTGPSPTIGCNNEFYDGENVWKFAGWCWSHDHFTSGSGTPIGWLPLLDETDAAARPRSDYHEDMGPVVWWVFPVDEPSWIGTPNDDDWPGYHTHWTPHPRVPVNDY